MSPAPSTEPPPLKIAGVGGRWLRRPEPVVVHSRIGVVAGPVVEARLGLLDVVGARIEGPPVKIAEEAQVLTRVRGRSEVIGLPVGREEPGYRPDKRVTARRDRRDTAVTAESIW